MKLLAENHSMYPRVGESDEDLRLRRAHHRFDHGEIDESELKRIEDDYVEQVIREQEEAGLDLVTDGMVRWYDHISHLAQNIAGAEVAGLVRYFDTNYLVREARITDHIEWRSPLTVGGFEFAHTVSNRPVKAILTGPLTMARHSILDDSPYLDVRSIAEDYASVLRQEVRALSEAGMTELQIEEPSLLQSPSDAQWTLPLIDHIIGNGSGINVRLATYFGDANPIYDDLQQTDVDALLFDFTYSSDLSDTIRDRGSEKAIGMGLLNGRNTKLSDINQTEKEIRALLNALDEDRHFISFSCSIDYLPRDRARRKLKQLAKIRDRVSTSEGAVQA